MAFREACHHDAAMKTIASTSLTRRRVIGGLAMIGASPLLGAQAFGQQALDAWDLGIFAGKAEDQSAAFQKAVDEAVTRELPLALPAGRFNISNIVVPSGLMLTGVPGLTDLVLNSPGFILRIDGAHHVTLDGLSLRGEFDTANPDGGLLELNDTFDTRLSRLTVAFSSSNGIACRESNVRIADCEIYDCAGVAIFSTNGRSAMFTGNAISGSGDGGILVWREATGRDGTVVSGNRINATDARSGGNGQNGNAINVFRADNVIVTDNVLTDCLFTAIRLNSTNDTQVTGNTCINCGEVAIFSEFAFSGSIIANNIVDRAAGGISMTNFNDGGRLAVCTGNIVRNIFPKSDVNPDVAPFGIFAEADAVVSNNVIEAVPGIGIGAGYGPYLRDVHVSDNVVREVDIGIGISVAEGAGAAQVVDNHVSGARLHAIAGMAWQDVVSGDLAADAAQFPHVTVDGNTVG
jgi:uncharacterized secreted repeat protein (TIGR03808 family)